MSKTQIRGPQRMGAQVLDEGRLTERVVDSYAGLTTAEAQAQGQPAASAILPLRRALWRLAEQLIPLRLAAALRARCATSDPTGRDGVRELRAAIADWLDPPPCCRWCRRPIWPGVDDARLCSRRRWSAGGGYLVCKASKSRRAPGGGPARCGTLALFPAGYVSLATMAAALACPKGAASGYDVAADRDCKALLAATAPHPPRDPDDAEAWHDEAVRLIHAAVVRVGGSAPLPPVILAARAALQAARDRNVRVNGRMGLAVQLRYYAPRDGVTRADLVQGAATGVDRAGLDYDESKARFPTYGAAWARQGCGEAWAARDVVGTPTWVLDLRRQVEERLHAYGPGAVRDLLCTVEALADTSAAAAALTLARLLAVAETVDLVPAGPRMPRQRRRPLFPGALAVAAADELDDTLGASQALAWLAAGLMAAAERPPPKKPPKRSKVSKPTLLAAEDPERARERIAAAIVSALELGDASGPGMLAALRHGAPVFVAIGAGGDDAEDAQGTDGAGGSERAAAVLAAPDELAAQDEERDAAAEWQAALSALAALRASSVDGADHRGAEAAEVIRRHHGLDSMAEERSGAGGESFQTIAETGLVCSGRRLSKETLRKIYNRGIAALQAIARGDAPDLGLLGDGTDEWADDPLDWGRWSPVHAGRSAAGAVLRSPFRPLAPPTVATQTSAPPAPREAVDGGAWEAFRDAAASVAW